jgi:hypothetical protein
MTIAYAFVMLRSLRALLPVAIAGALAFPNGACVAEEAGDDESDLIDPSQPGMDKARLDVILRRRNIRTLDQLPANLPKDFLINFTLKHGKLRTGERGHLVERDVSQSSDPLAPRVIMWDERTGFTISYNGGTPGQTEGQRLDVHEFDAATRTFRLHGLEFSGSGAPVYKTDATITDPARKCARCHGPDGRPIFSMYPDWPSFYGSDNDELTNTSREVQRLEAEDYRKFRSLVTTSKPPRYAPLFDPVNVPAKLRGTALYPTYPYRMNHSEEANDISRSFAFRPSLRLGILANRLMAQAAMARIQKHPNYARFRAFFLHELLECRWPNANDLTQSGWTAAVQQAIGSAPRMAPGVRTTHYRDLLKVFGLDVRDVDIRFSYNHEGYKTDDATTNVMSVGYMEDGYWNSYFDGSATFDELLAMALYNDLGRDPAFANLRGVITNPDGLVVKYERRAARFQFDQNFFREMDRKGEWIPIPYPPRITNIHHREGYPTRYATQHQNLCRALESKLMSGPGTGGDVTPVTPVTPGAACAPGCIYSSFCVDRNATAKRYPATGGGQVVCVQQGNCAAECTVR